MRSPRPADRRDPSAQALRVVTEPIRQSVTVRGDRRHTFDVFVRRIGDWWPVQPFSMGKERVIAVRFETRLDGRVYEVWADGTERVWGKVIIWEPPSRFAITWELHSTPTEVELRFRALAAFLTRVDLEHRGWERLSEDERLAACAYKGGYVGGWELILGRFAELAAEETGPPR